MPKDEEIAPVFTSLISSSHLFKKFTWFLFINKILFYFNPTAISQEPNRLKANPLNQTDLTQKLKRRFSPNAALERTSCQTSPIYLPGETLIYPREQKQHKHVEHNTAFHRGTSVTMQEQPQGLCRGSQPKPSRGARNCCWVHPGVHVQHHDTALQPREKVATDQMDWSSLEVAQDPEENSRNATWPGAFISKRKPLGSPHLSLSIRAPHGILS